MSASQRLVTGFALVLRKATLVGPPILTRPSAGALSPVSNRGARGRFLGCHRAPRLTGNFSVPTYRPSVGIVDTLTVIQGIGIAAENRLSRAGIKSCSELAGASPQEIREILGYLAQGSDIERWIEQARELICEQAL